MALSKAERGIADDLLSHNLDLLRLDASLRKDAVKLLKSLQQELKVKLAAGTLTEYSKAATDFLLVSSKAIIDKYYKDVQRTMDEALSKLPAVENAAVRSALVEVGYGAALAPANQFAVAMTDIMILGAPSSSWWERQSADVAFRFANVVRQGIVQGDTNQQIISRIVGTQGQAGVMEIARRNAAALVQTSVQTVANYARMESFRQNADIVQGVMQLSTLDSHTTDICMAYSGAEWNLEEEPINGNKLPFNGGPPRHFNCRSVLIPVTATFAELGITAKEDNFSTRASVDGQVKANLSFSDFLDRKGEAFQNKVLGVGRADLWRSGKITLPQLLNLDGNPLSLKQLQAKYDK